MPSKTPHRDIQHVISSYYKRMAMGAHRYASPDYAKALDELRVLWERVSMETGDAPTLTRAEARALRNAAKRIWMAAPRVARPHVIRRPQEKP